MRNKLPWLWAGALLSLLHSVGWASLPALPPPPPAQAVSELLMLDARRALAAERQRYLEQQAGAGPQEAGLGAIPLTSVHDADPPAKLPVLTSIYGVGNRLHAEVLIDGHETLYVNGRAQALNDMSTPWRLKRLAPPCIDLESDSSAMRLCAAQAGSAP
ncbi:hypothetical protein H0484_04030 [Pusillimonas sp. CC-YST705]|uniref:Type IV pilus biogenesis protein PilP n=1 Tax=Mesopusillimonas faecipullorum TaxID=2755040 RepID=A0ABS8CA52_9BURK|nr:hypothetical protein [Mesopusillimonas faecipullorum]MCB5362924.1 hypothetical protein [Mesopusillimonas faecipullorum]